LRVVTSLNPVEIFKTTRVALRDGFQAARTRLSQGSRSSSFQSSVASEEDEEEGGFDASFAEARSTSDHGKSTPRLKTTKSASFLSHESSNVSDASSHEEGKNKPILGRLRSLKEARSRKRPDSEIGHKKDDDFMDAASGKKARIRRLGSLRPRHCVIQ
jgi:hypothetical protein